ncbi:MAG: D-glycero-alpha-D-manno-heptose-1,7-bisphosphate 7-phosphatase [Pyrinomonadaceae bacterium]
MNLSQTKKPAVFIDRDGTLIEEVNFLSRLEDLRFFSYTNEAVKLLKENGFLIIVVTNQSGIGREIFDEAAMHRIHEQIQTDLPEKLDGFYFCPHLPTDGCYCRKPNPGMIEAACSDFSIDLQQSWMIGDKALDAELGFNAGIKTSMVLTGYGKKDLAKLSRKPDIVAENLLEAVLRILQAQNFSHM